jgi:hypothetical protein
MEMSGQLPGNVTPFLTRHATNKHFSISLSKLQQALNVLAYKKIGSKKL